MLATFKTRKKIGNRLIWIYNCDLLKKTFENDDMKEMEVNSTKQKAHSSRQIDFR